MRQVAFCVLLAALVTAAQQPPPAPRTLLVAHQDSIGLRREVTSTCIYVLPDGRYHLERLFNPPDRDSEIHIYEDRLSAEDLQVLRTILDAPEFRQLNSLPGGVRPPHSQVEKLAVEVWREPEPQAFDFRNLEDPQPFKGPLKPFLSWLKSMERRKSGQLKDPIPNGCMPPAAPAQTASQP